MITECCHIDANGEQCRKRKGLKRMRYHGDPELCNFTERSAWVVIALCSVHFKPWLSK